MKPVREWSTRRKVVVCSALTFFLGVGVGNSDSAERPAPVAEQVQPEPQQDAPPAEQAEGQAVDDAYTPVPNDPSLQAVLQEGISERAPGVTITRARVAAGALEIETNIVDPKGPNGSPEAAQAVAVCQVAYELTGQESIRVEDSRGIGFVRRTENGAGDLLPPKTCWEL